MKAAVISPLSMLEKYSGQSTFHMALAHLVLSDASYREYYLDRSRAGEFVMLDNGVVETGEPYAIEDIVRAADAIEASEIVLPDMLNVTAGSFARTMEALRWLQKAKLLGKYKLLAVPQGGTAVSWVNALALIQSLPEVSSIGISKFAHSLVAGGRERLLEVMEAFNVVDENREYHLLGVWEDPMEVLRVRNANPWVRSVDSCIPVLSGLCNVPFPDPMRTGDYHRPAIDMNFYATDDAYPEVTDQNVKSFIYWAEGD